MVDIAIPKFSDWKSEAIRKQVEINNETAAPPTDSQSSTPSTTNSATRFTKCLLDFSFRRDEKRSRRSGACDNISVNAPLEDRGLFNVPTSQLEKCLEPILVQLQELDAESLLGLTRVESGGARLCEGVQIRPIHNEIYPPEDEQSDNIDDDDDDEDASLHRLPAVRYIHLQEVPDQYSVGIFVFPPHGKIPLHDHPGMCVLSRILYGDIKRRSLDLPYTDDAESYPIIAGKKRRAFYRVPNQPNRKNSNHFTYAHQDSSGSSNDTSVASISPKIPIDTLVAPQCTVLYPHEGNLHEFMAGPNGAAVLDVLLPPYDVDHHRDCTFYEIDENYERDDQLQVSLPSSTATDFRLPVWIVPTGRPENFHCTSGQYRDLGS